MLTCRSLLAAHIHPRPNTELKRGDTCGELALLGAQRHPHAFVVVCSPKLLTVLVSAAQLADGIAALQHQAHQQQRTSGASTAAAAAGAAAQQPGPRDLSTDALYSLIGEPRGCSAGVLSSEQLQHVQRLQAQQLQAAAAAEAATVGASGWRQLTNRKPVAEATPATSSAPADAAVTRQPGEVQKQPSCCIGQPEVGQQQTSMLEHAPEQQPAAPRRCPLMHHAALVHVALVQRAAASGGQ
jgi:hypothetical protein